MALSAYRLSPAAHPHTCAHLAVETSDNTSDPTMPLQSPKHSADTLPQAVPAHNSCGTLVSVHQHREPSLLRSCLLLF